MISRQTFFDRLRYGKHTFADGDNVYAKPHINPDGTKGGWVAETALVEPTCTIAPDAEVYEYAQVRDKARILGAASVYGFALVGENALVTDWASINDSAVVQGKTYIGNSVIICGDSYIDYGHLDSDRIYNNRRQILKGKNHYEYNGNWNKYCRNDSALHTMGNSRLS